MTWTLLVAGCGTAGLAVLSAVASRAGLRSTLRGIACVDNGRVETRNMTTCPELEGYVGRAKSVAAANLADRLLPESARVITSMRDVEDVDWEELLRSISHGETVDHVVALLALDDWSSRLCLVEDLRRMAPRMTACLTIIQVGLERNLAQVSVFGPNWTDRCPACGLASLPASEPCSVLDEKRQPARGALQRERRAAASHVCRVLEDLQTAGREHPWRNTKTNLEALAPAGRGFRSFTRRKFQVAGCLGPHSPDTPLSAAEIVSLGVTP